MKDLIERLERATGPDIELGAEIVCRIRGLRYLSVESRKTMRSEAIAVCAEDDMRERFEFWANDPTASLDAALTLVPDGWHAIIDHRYNLDGHATCVLHEFPQPCRRIPEQEPYVILARTGPIALCIAALKAREAAK